MPKVAFQRSEKNSLRFRQVHLDFHTHGDIPGVGEHFDKHRFQSALKTGCVDSITLFAKCHHGWSYHPTKIGRAHPHLTRNLLGEQIDACREIDVRCPLYVSAGLDELMAMEHPEWVLKHKDGSTYKPLEVGGFKTLRFNSPYLDYLCAQVEEINDLWPDNDGIFFDIVAPRLDYSEGALREMKSLGLDPADDKHAARYAMQILERYFKRTTASARSRNPRNRVFHNSGNISIGARRLLSFNSHLELESLPTGGWGWDHFPLTACYARTTGYEYLGMTGKFHTSWGEFGGFKRAASLRYETSVMLALGARCSVGDQLHPSGEMNPDTYRLLGEAYSEVEAKEPWCTSARAVAKIALVSAARDQHTPRPQNENLPDDEGASRMLLELHQPFDVLDSQATWNGYEVIILPDSFLFTPTLLKRAQAFLKKGGRILSAGASLLDADRTRFALEMDAQLVGRSQSDPDYLLATVETASVPVRSAIVIHGKAWNAKPARTARVLARRADAYFNRTWDRFCSHQHAPDAAISAYPGGLLNAEGNIAWFAHDLFTRYRHYGQPLYRDFVKAALCHLFPAGLPVETTLPSGGRVALHEQPHAKRYVFHLLFGTPAVRGGRPLDWIQHMEIIEELIPLHDIGCVVRVPRRIKSVRLVPSGETIAFAQDAGKEAVRFTVPRLEGHQLVELSYA